MKSTNLRGSADDDAPVFAVGICGHRSSFRTRTHRRHRLLIDGDTIEIKGKRIRLMETGELIWRRRTGSRIFGCVDLTTRYYLGDNMSGQSRRAALGWALLKSS
jgi:hypothetical protein